MTIKVRLFAVAKDLAGFHEGRVELPDASTAGDVLTHLANIDLRFSRWRSSMRLAVNQEYVGLDHELRDDDEVAVIPPVSGG